MKQFTFNSGKILLGVLIITAGILLFLFQTGVLSPDYKRIIFSWQMLLIGIGLVGLFSWRKLSSSLLIILIGVFFLIPKLEIEAFGFINGSHRWPIIIVIIGIVIIFKAMFRRNEGHTSCRARHHRVRYNEQDSGYIYREYVFGGSKEQIDVKNFKGGQISCVFGGMELDLSHAELAEGMNTLDIRTVFGGVSIYVPADWHIEIRQQQVMGSFQDRRPKSYLNADNDKILIINAEMVLGGGEIKCK